MGKWLLKLDQVIIDLLLNNYIYYEKDNMFNFFSFQITLTLAAPDSILIKHLQQNKNNL